MARIVEAKIKKVPNDKRLEFDFFRSLCGRETGPDQFDCGCLGKIMHITWPVGVDLLSPEASSYEYAGAADHATLGLFDLRVGLRGLETAHVTPVSLLPWSRYDPTPPPHQRIWVAYHERGYRERPDGEFEIINRKSRWKNPHLIAGNRAVGNRPMPEEFVERIAERANFPSGSGYEMPPDDYGLVGARPALPAVIRCPDCGVPNRVGALAFDDQRGIWYTVRTR